MLTSSAPRPWRRASQSEERQRIRSRAPTRGAAEREAPARIEPARRRGWLAQGARPARAAARREAWHRWIGGPPLWRVLGPGKKGLKWARQASGRPGPGAACVLHRRQNQGGAGPAGLQLENTRVVDAGARADRNGLTRCGAVWTAESERRRRLTTSPVRSLPATLARP